MKRFNLFEDSVFCGFRICLGEDAENSGVHLWKIKGSKQDNRSGQELSVWQGQQLRRSVVITPCPVYVLAHTATPCSLCVLSHCHDPVE